MKRFYCVKCQKVRRVRKLPYNLNKKNFQSTNPADRNGLCDRHEKGNK